MKEQDGERENEKYVRILLRICIILFVPAKNLGRAKVMVITMVQR